jgi:hypothetical protein
MRRNGPRKAIHRTQVSSQLIKAQPTYSLNTGPAHYSTKPQSAAQRNSLEHLKRRGKSGFQAPFSLPLGTMLKALKRKHFQSKDQVSKAAIIMTRADFLH